MDRLNNWDYGNISKLLRLCGYFFWRSLKGSYVEWKNKDGKKIKFPFKNKKRRIYSHENLSEIFRKAGINEKQVEEWTKLPKTKKKNFKFA